jgi:hypothetical protein
MICVIGASIVPAGKTLDCIISYNKYFVPYKRETFNLESKNLCFVQFVETQ